MDHFLMKNPESHRLELLVDTKIFSVNGAMKAAYLFLDRAYFFFRMDWENLFVQIQPKEWQEWSPEKFANEYSDELLATHLRSLIESENKTVRETIVRRALWSYADLPHFTSIEVQNKTQQNHLDKDIDEILREIENDPDLKIDEEEINRILSEIENENQEMKKPSIDPNKLKDVKKNFHNK